MNDLIKKYSEKLKNPRVLIIIGVIGIGLIFISSFIPEKPKTSQSVEEFSVVEYKEALEKDIAKLVKSISGSRKVTVIITLESGMNYQYADNLEESNDTKNDNLNTVNIGKAAECR